MDSRGVPRSGEWMGWGVRRWRGWKTKGEGRKARGDRVGDRKEGPAMDREQDAAPGWPARTRGRSPHGCGRQEAGPHDAAACPLSDLRKITSRFQSPSPPVLRGRGVGVRGRGAVSLAKTCDFLEGCWSLAPSPPPLSPGVPGERGEDARRFREVISRRFLRARIRAGGPA